MVSPHASPCVFIGAGCAEMNSRRSMAGQRLILRFPASVGAARVLRPNVLYWTGSTPLVALLKLYRKLRGVSRPLHYVGSFESVQASDADSRCYAKFRET